ncbi:uncharacterized protein Triagg1_7461 [Trichoderma aggressivum f. europaeum]|uniref:Uncharacterized protein n=1 Tax=Trichoderma aggressivum f. europaeum TaxID=173218 RepID=A0AAE1I9K6_9HYPO|nr:hypothetical protein Triagg1_7461 [Trichoderma aggressivum f. europaeum]
MEPLDALQSLINDVLVQTGKALRASRRDAQGNLTHAYGPTQSKLPDTIDHFHNALNELESEIEKKKKLLARPTPQPVEAQAKRPPNMDLPSPPEPIFKDEPMAEDADVKPMAPFPNMSIDLAEAEPMDMSIKEPNGQQLQQQQQPPPPGGMNGLNGTASPGDKKPTADMLPEPSASNQPPVLPEGSGMHFTDMEFTLAPPPGSEVPGQPSASKEPSFDLTTFAPADGGDDLLNLNHLLPADPSSSAAQANPGQVKMENVKVEVPDATMNTDFFGPESGAADGMDFDFSIGGTGDDTFDDLMNNRDSTFELMDAGGDFDTAFFGLDKPDENPA